jgi:uncharacterized protein (TIGR00251 family)
MKRIDDLPDGRLSFVVAVTPRASRNAISGWSAAGHLKVRIAAPPVEGAANRALLRYLAKELEVRKGDLSIDSGEHSRTKRIVAPSACKNRLSSLGDI